MQKSVLAVVALLLPILLLLRQGCAFSTTTSSTTAAVRSSRRASLRMWNLRRHQPPHLLSLSLAKKTTTNLKAARTTITTKSKETTKSPVAAVGKVLQQKFALDGGEWISIRNRLKLEEYVIKNKNKNEQQQQQDEPSSITKLTWKQSSKFGLAVVATGSVNGKRIVGLQAINHDNNDNNDVVPLDQDENIRIYKDSMSEIPDNVQEEIAIKTLVQCLSLHCVLPTLSNVGGDDTGTTTIMPQNGSVVILGGNDYAMWAATVLTKALSCSQVTLVTENKKLSRIDSSSSVGVINVIPPSNANGESFSNNLQQFDSLLDTIYDEQQDNVGSGGGYAVPSRGSGVIGRLGKLHGCHTYVSTMSRSQQLIIEQGLLWGPGKTKEHAQTLSKSVLSKKKRGGGMAQYAFPSPRGLGQTVSRILESGLFPPPMNNNGMDDVHVRGWSLKDFWEYTTWPREAGTNVRFGLPVNERLRSDWLEDENDDDEEAGVNAPMVSAPPLSPDELIPQPPDPTGELDTLSDPCVLGISSVKGLQRIFQDEMDCVVFLSAPFCRTCRYLKPKYQRMARKYSTDDKYKGFVFAKAEAPGPMGKELGKTLDIDAVPAFVLFRKGRRYGKVLNMSRLPSKKLETAIEYLQNGKEWNEKVIDSTEDNRGFDGGTGQAKNNRRTLL